MKNNIKLVISFVFGALIFSSFIAYATSIFLASQISFRPNETSWNVNNIEDAINDLYAKKNINNFIGNFYLSGYYNSDPSSKQSFFEINVNDYNKLKVNINHIYNNSRYYTAQLFVDDEKVFDFDINNKEVVVDLSNAHIAKIYYYEISGYYYMDGTYELINE